jgi:hypothetical protein
MDRGTRNPIPDPPFIGRRAIRKSGHRRWIGKLARVCSQAIGFILIYSWQNFVSVIIYSIHNIETFDFGA